MSPILGAGGRCSKCRFTLEKEGIIFKNMLGLNFKISISIIISTLYTTKWNKLQNINDRITVIDIITTGN